MPNTFLLFPGQGSQFVGMGHTLTEGSQIARKLFERADHVLGFKLSQICFQGPIEKLTETSIAQPAILTCSVAALEVALDQQVIQQEEICGAAGHSLGEYSALVAAKALTFEDAVRLVHKRGSYMQKATPLGTGKMAAVLGSSLDEIEDAITQLEKNQQLKVEVANLNAPGQIVVAGSAQAIDGFIEKSGLKAKVLPVSAPFHSSLMKPAADLLAADIAETKFIDAEFPVISNFSAKPVTSSSEIQQALVEQVCGKVRWIESMQYAVSHYQPNKIYEVGPRNVLAGLMKRIDKSQDVQSLGEFEQISATQADGREQ